MGEPPSPQSSDLMTSLPTLHRLPLHPPPTDPTDVHLTRNPRALLPTDVTMSSSSSLPHFGTPLLL